MVPSSPTLVAANLLHREGEDVAVMGGWRPEHYGGRLRIWSAVGLSPQPSCGRASAAALVGDDRNDLDLVDFSTTMSLSSFPPSSPRACYGCPFLLGEG